MKKLILSDIGEKQLLEELLEKITPSPYLINGLGNDSAFIDIALAEDEVLLMNTDRSGINIAYKMGISDARCVGDFAVSHAVSDIFVAGGKPIAISLALLLPSDLSVEFVKAVMSGADFAARKYGAFIAAGDTKNNPKFGIVVTVAGKGAKNRILTRSNACPGDALVSIGWYGTMLAGLLAFKHGLALNQETSFLFRKALTYQNPPYELSMSVAEAGICHASIDNSDGLSGSIHSLCKKSGLGAIVYADRVPIRKEVRNVAETMGLDPFQLALGSGDWQHIYAVPQDCVSQFLSLASKHQMMAAVIGEFTENKSVRIRKNSRDYIFPCLENDRFGIGGTSWFELLSSKIDYLGDPVW